MNVVWTKNINVFLVGLAFLLVFTAFQTMSNIQTVIIESAQDELSDGYVEGFNGQGYISLAIIYVVSAVFNWLAPSTMAVLGHKFTMAVGAFTYAAFIASFFYLNDILLYTASGVIGVGAALLWTAQGAFLTANSTEKTMGRNAGIFWAMFQCSLLIGNTFAYFQFRDTDDIDEDTRTTFVAVLLGFGLAGTVTFFFLLPTPWINSIAKEEADSPIQALTRSFRLFATPEMLQLLFYFFYMGMQLTFYSGVYGPSLGFTESFPDPKSLTGLHGILIGVGEICGGLTFGIFGHVTNKIGRYPVVVLGTVLQFVAFVGIFLNIPNDAPLGTTQDTGYLDPPIVGIAISCSVLLGIGDACYNTQTMSLLGGIYPDQAGPAFAIFKFVQSVSAAAGFGYAGYIPLYYHIGLLWLLGTVGTFFFVKIDIQTRKKESRWKVMEETAASAKMENESP